MRWRRCEFIDGSSSKPTSKPAILRCTSDCFPMSLNNWLPLSGMISPLEVQQPRCKRQPPVMVPASEVGQRHTFKSSSSLSFHSAASLAVRAATITNLLRTALALSVPSKDTNCGGRRCHRSRFFSCFCLNLTSCARGGADEGMSGECMTCPECKPMSETDSVVGSVLGATFQGW